MTTLGTTTGQVPDQTGGALERGDSAIAASATGPSKLSSPRNHA